MIIRLKHSPQVRICVDPVFQHLWSYLVYALWKKRQNSANNVLDCNYTLLVRDVTYSSWFLSFGILIWAFASERITLTGASCKLLITRAVQVCRSFNHFLWSLLTIYLLFSLLVEYFKVPTSWIVHLEELIRNFSRLSFVIRVNLLHP